MHNNKEQYNNALLSRPTVGLHPWLMWGLGALFYCFEFFLQVSPSVMVPDLMRSFAVSGEQLGMLASLYFYAYASMQIPAGMLLDRLGARRLLSIAILLCSAGALIFGSSYHFAIACIGRFIIGLGSAFAAVGCMHLAATWLPLRRFALLAGIMMTLGMVGAICGQAPLALVVAHFGWRVTLLLFGVLGVLLSIIIYSVIRDRPFENDFSTPQVNRLSFLSGLLHILKERQSWIIAIYGCLVYGPTSAFGALWGVPFLMSAYRVSRPIAATLVSMIFVGWAVSAPLFGWFSDKIHRRKITMMTASVGGLFCMLFVLYIHHMPLLLLGASLFMFGFFCSGFLPSFSAIREIHPPQYNATALGFMNTLNMIGGAALQPFIGCILDLHWRGKMELGARVYSLGAYHIALMVLPISLLLSLLILPFIKETYCKYQY